MTKDLSYNPFNVLKNVQVKPEEREEGTVKWFNDDKGFGFLSVPSGDIFVHYAEIEGKPKTLKKNERISCQVISTPKGKKATKVRKLT